jgi:hypothetical protein
MILEPPRLVKRVNNVLNVAVYRLTRSLIISSCNNGVINQMTVFYGQMIQKTSFEPQSTIFISLGRNRPASIIWATGVNMMN